MIENGVFWPVFIISKDGIPPTARWQDWCREGPRDMSLSLLLIANLVNMQDYNQVRETATLIHFQHILKSVSNPLFLIKAHFAFKVVFAIVFSNSLWFKSLSNFRSQEKPQSRYYRYIIASQIIFQSIENVFRKLCIIHADFSFVFFYEKGYISSDFFSKYL